jgi:hypothetical protein
MKTICEWLNGKNRGRAFLAGNVEDGKSKPESVDDFYGFEDKGGLAFSLGTLSAFIQRLFS